jgi:hypothetical protein
LISAFAVIAVVGVLLAWFGKIGWWFPLASSVLIVSLFILSRFRKPPELPPNPWVEHHSVVTTSIEPKRVVFCIDDRGDGQLWCLFDLDDGRWLICCDEDFPYDEHLTTILARGEVMWSWLGDNTDVVGLPWELRSDGVTIPMHGVTDVNSDSAVDDAIAAGFRWSPKNEGELVSAVDLPSWITDWDVSPPPIDFH